MEDTKSSGGDVLPARQLRPPTNQQRQPSTFSTSSTQHTCGECGELVQGPLLVRSCLPRCSTSIESEPCHRIEERPRDLGGSSDARDLDMDQHGQGQQLCPFSGKDGSEQGNSDVESYLTTDPTDSGSQDPGERPPLPPRPTLNLLDENAGSPKAVRQQAQSNLQSKATTAVSLPDINFQSDGPKDIRSLPGTLRAKASLSQVASSRGSETGDSASVRSSLVNPDVGEIENVFDDFVATEPGGVHQDSAGLLLFPEFQADKVDDDFAVEFESLGEIDETGENEGL